MREYSSLDYFEEIEFNYLHRDDIKKLLNGQKWDPIIEQKNSPNKQSRPNSIPNSSEQGDLYQAGRH